MMRVFYPPQVEAWWLAAAQRATGREETADALAALEADAGRLSDAFTVARPAAFGDYSADPRGLAAYGILFFPQTFARVRRVLAEWRQVSGNLPDRPLRVLDLGCGAGAATLAALLELQPRPVSVTALDHSPHALAGLRQLFAACRDLWPAASLTTEVADVRRAAPAGPFDLILASFVLNEVLGDAADDAVESWLRGLLACLAPAGSLAVIEPAGAATCERLQRLRNRFAADPAVVLQAPCPHRRACPLLGAGCGYCHDVRSWRVPDSVSLINRRLQRSVHDLKHGLLVLGGPAATSPAWQGDSTCFRMVAPLNRAKGRLVTRGCRGDGTLCEIEWMTRGAGRETIDALLARERGDVLRMTAPRLLGDNRTWRAEALAAISAESALGRRTEC